MVYEIGASYPNLIGGSCTLTRRHPRKKARTRDAGKKTRRRRKGSCEKKPTPSERRKGCTDEILHVPQSERKAAIVKGAIRGAKGTCSARVRQRQNQSKKARNGARKTLG